MYNKIRKHVNIKHTHFRSNYKLCELKMTLQCYLPHFHLVQQKCPLECLQSLTLRESFQLSCEALDLQTGPLISNTQLKSDHHEEVPLGACLILQLGMQFLANIVTHTFFHFLRSDKLFTALLSKRARCWGKYQKSLFFLLLQ